jgi:ABC-type Fe3+/spermidine/putrescine transport system ATPase subunit
MKISLQRVSKSYGPGAAGVRAVDLEIRPQEFLTIMGPSGAGKSTLLHLISGALFPDGGRILFDDADVTTRPPELRPVHTVFQGLHLFPHLSVEENVAFALRRAPRPPPREEIRARVAEILKQVGLEGFGDRRVTQLSGGEKQRVAIARSLIDRPPALLLDEPFAPLDRPLKESLIDLILSLKRRSGLTIVLTTHDWFEALRLSDRIAVIRRGALVQAGTPQELYFQPRTLSIARLTGPMNVLEGRLENGRLIADGLSLEAEGSGPATFGIRPAFVSLGDGPIEGTVEEVLFAGSAHQVRLRVGSSLVLQAECARAPARGERLRLSIPRERLVRLERDDA